MAWRQAWSGLARRMGGMVVAPRRTLHALLAGEGDALEVVVLALLVVTAIYPATVLKYVLLSRVDAGMAFSKLLGSNGFYWTRLMNQAGCCAVASAGFFGLGLLTRRRVAVWSAVTAGFHLYVPMAVLALLGLLLEKVGVSWPWLPHHPLDGWWVWEGNQPHLMRFYGKLVVEMAWPTVVGLWAAWTWWRQAPPAPATPQTDATQQAP